MPCARNLVLGAGATGAAAVYQLARRGEPVLLVEQFALGHDRGSSHGAARIIRHSYADERYARLMPAAYAAWRELEADAGRPLVVRTGGVSLSPRGVGYVAEVVAALESIGCPHRRMTGRELRGAISVFDVPDDHDAVFEPDAGMILAARAMEAELELARSRGGGRTIIRDNTRARRIDLDASRPTLVLDDGEAIEADRLIVAAGPWTARLFPGLASRLRVERQQVLYFSPTDSAPYAIGRLPVFISVGRGPRDLYYGMPGVLGMGVKCARHGGDIIDPDADDRTIAEGYRDEVRGFLRGCLPAMADAPITHSEICKYTVAPNEDFLVGPWPGRPDVIVASPCSGHGFKFSCLIGRVLADLAISGETNVGDLPWCHAVV